MPRQNGVAYLDGIRGIAAFLVFINHFSLAFYPAYYFQKPEASHLNGLDMTYGHSYLSFLTQGGYAVAIFFVLSGFVLSRKYFLSNDIEDTVSGLHRRFIRLFVPIGVTLIISFVLMSSSAYFNDPVSRITLSEWFIKQWRFAEPLTRFISSFTYGTMFCGDASFDTCLWTMSYEFYGSLFVFAFLIFTHFTRFRILMMFFAMYYFYMVKSPFYMAFVLGMTLNYTEQWIAKRNDKLATVKAVVLLVVSLLMGSSPFLSPQPDTWQENLQTQFWDYTPWCMTMAAYLLVLAYVMSPVLQKMVSFRPFRFLGYISFSLYLLHPIIIGSFSSWLFLKLYDGPASYNHSTLVVFLTTAAFIIGASWLMAKYVDQYGIRLAKRAYEYVRKPLVVAKAESIKPKADSRK